MAIAPHLLDRALPRDWTLPGESGAPVSCPRVPRQATLGVEWRFAYFRYQNALLIVKATVRLIAELVASGRPMDADLQKYIDALRSSVEPLQNRMH